MDLQEFMRKELSVLNDRVKDFIWANYPHKKGDCLVTQSGEKYYLDDIKLDLRQPTDEPLYIFLGPQTDKEVFGLNGVKPRKCLVFSSQDILQYQEEQQQC